MQSRRDQVQAQSFVWSRLVTALVVADADASENPNRRMVVGTVSGILVAALVVAGFTVYGLLKPGGASSWQKPGVLVVEKESGSRYLYAGGKLRPVLNYTSARLLFPAEPKVVSVSRRSLADVPHGQPLGIVGAPDAIPAAGRVAGQVWTVCAASAKDQTGRTTTATTLAITGPDAPSAAGPGPDEAVLASAGDRRFLLWRGYRLRLMTAWLPRVLGADGPGLPVEDSWLETVPAGPDLAPLTVAGRGSAGPAIDGQPSRIGELFTARDANGVERNYLLRADGLAPLGSLAHAIATADPETARLYGGPVRPREISLAGLAQMAASQAPVLPEGIPGDLPRIIGQAPSGTTWCARHRMSDGRVELAADRPVSTTGLVVDGIALRRTTRTATAVSVAAGQGGLVAAGRFGQALGAVRYLVTDAGVKYPVTDTDSAARLGFAATDTRPVPPRLLDLLPTGPALGTAMVLG
ncbi:type VII secretion protein EccB [Actinoplanes sp. NBRC 103695]|uniref:type VII secretion protein EccB n=1 Tax=Actinoplanes sp. NBRC 103695 TaxID=3032202 RepID=UPI0024A426EB|nr:type VII secretion protein EccB [Actinoplanes sp. NBRC 103695]GLY93152.1 type VII secretion protein EccB [Actinoplanes sp. NBRC 103695]